MPVQCDDEEGGEIGGVSGFLQCNPTYLCNCELHDFNHYEPLSNFFVKVRICRSGAFSANELLMLYDSTKQNPKGNFSYVDMTFICWTQSRVSLTILQDTKAQVLDNTGSPSRNLAVGTLWKTSESSVSIIHAQGAPLLDQKLVL